ncbi:MAG: class I SAM-dependent methyltransferase [Geminicoccaceae bacterium]|nr:class I SAM-dependent methyltransferase [Geminicoccaceae bacterium]
MVNLGERLENGGGGEAAGQRWSAEGYARNARFVADLGMPVVELLAPRLGERVLDLGCGDGSLSVRIAALGPEVLGTDASPELLGAARGLGLQTVLADAHALPFEREFDAVFSNAALHWMLEPEKVIAGVARALVPGGRFVGEMGGFANVATIATALRAGLQREGVDGMAIHPWYFPTPQEYGGLLRAAGFSVTSIELIPRPTPLPTGMEGWLETFAAPFLAHAPGERHADLLDHAVALMRPSLCDRAGNWVADYVRLRFSVTLDPATG